MPKIEVSRQGAPAKKVEVKPGPDLTLKDIHPDGHECLDAKPVVKPCPPAAEANQAGAEPIAEKAEA